MEVQEDGSPQVMLGDWNTGPVGPNSEGEYPENYAVIEADGWQNENIESGNPFATWDPSNTLWYEDGTPISTIDHIFVKNSSVQNTRRVFDELVNLSEEGEPEFLSNLSDHYGIAATITFDP